MGTNGFRLFLRLGDIVTHRDYLQWGEGRVVEEMTSTVPGGTCLVRVQFQDGRTRTFNNDLDAEACCYYFGIRKYWDPERAFGAAAAPRRVERSRPRRTGPAPRSR
ncbi:MAG: hypothetical protein AB7V27_09210 [Candidatus Binatia bacterium]